jgi:hypothetical protein
MLVALDGEFAKISPVAGGHRLHVVDDPPDQP